jgi:hypothetical protein
VNQAKNLVRAYSARRAAVDSSSWRREVINFLIKIGETDPVVLASSGRPGDVFNFIDDLREFGLGATLIDVQKLATEIAIHPRRTLGKLVEDVRDLLAAAADGKQFIMKLPSRSELKFNATVTRQFEQKLDISASFVSRWFRSSRQLPALDFIVLSLAVPQSSSWAAQLEVFVFNAMRHLDSEEGAMVRRCRREACRKIFLAALSKQIFCTRKCQSTTAFARHKKKPGYVEKHRTSAKKSAQARRDLLKKRSQLQQKLLAKGKD